MKSLLFLAMLLAACGGGKIAPSSRTIFVAPLGRGGNDANDGSADKPFATIAKALSVAQSTDTISVKPGTYGVGGTGLAASPGETFPIRLKEGVALVGSGTFGETASILQALRFDSTPHAVVIMAAGARLESFQIDAGGEIGIFSDATEGTIASNTMTSVKTGLQIAGGGVTVSDNLLSSGGESGVVIDGGTPFFTKNRIVTNGIGAVINGGAPHFEGNSLGCNSQLEMVNNTSSTVSARNNAWAPFPPPRVSGGPVDTTGGSLGNC